MQPEKEKLIPTKQNQRVLLNIYQTLVMHELLSHVPGQRRILRLHFMTAKIILSIVLPCFFLLMPV